MASPSSIKNSKLMTEFQRDLERYQKEMGKSTREVIAVKALDFSIKYSKLLAKEAPTRASIDSEARNRGYNVRVRKKIVNQVGALDSQGTDYRGKFFGRRRAGEKGLNKRAIAVKRELAIRRQSVKWLSVSIAKWNKSQNKNIAQKNKVFGKSFTRRKTKQVGIAKGKFTGKKDSLRVIGEALGLEKADREKGDLSEKALEQSRVGTVKFLNDRSGKAFIKSFKKTYK